MDENISAGKLLKLINSSCSSGRERRKSVSGIIGRLMWPHVKVIWKASIAWQMSVLPVRERVHVLPKTVISRYSNTYAKKQKRLGIILLRFGGLSGHLHILEYLVERKFEKYDACACMLAARNGHLECLKYLHETAKAPWDSHAVRKAHENNQPEYV